jgi:hypothetical protein
MPDETLNQQTDPAAGTPQGVDPALSSGAVSGQGEPQAQTQSRRQYSDEEIEQLVQFSNQAYSRLEALTPYEDKIKRIIEDEDYRQFVDSATSQWDTTRQQQQQQRQEEIPSWAKPMVEFVESQKQTQARVQTEDVNRFYSEQRVVGERLKRESQLNDSQINDLAFHADALATRYGRRVGLEEAYNHVKGFSAPQQHGAPPQVGLRGDASTPGVPSQSLNPDDFTKDFHGATLALLKRGGN